MPIEPVKIPQNVYIEDRIVGPLTLRQIILSMLGIGFSYAIWASIAKVYGTVPLHITVIVWLPAAVTIIFAFIRVNDLSMTHLFFLLIERMSKPQTRVYGPRRGLTVNARTFNAPTAHSQKVSAALPQAEGEIGKLSAFLDHEEVPEDNTATTLPPRPVQPGRIKVSPFLQDDIDTLLHPPASHA